MSVLEMFGRRFPFCGGGYFRLFPYSYTRYCMRKVNEQGRAVVFYLHPGRSIRNNRGSKTCRVLKSSGTIAI